VTRLLQKLPSSRSMSIVPLHGNLQGSSNSQVFERARCGHRKVVLSTNIAETSVTVGAKVL
jgi:HrpA-like RNA helicase